eukprot:TRINITY_DN1453_c0_g1_i1.p1 TRINITY_DN1453_c0_g1~~TRINITY_DN1453_c0_g1_i1.p1  ORF type:complete len:321 (-),score=29.53 TRINITY_DN1453_c0_g1_i1:270-1232(-)
MESLLSSCPLLANAPSKNYKFTPSSTTSFEVQPPAEEKVQIQRHFAVTEDVLDSLFVHYVPFDDKFILNNNVTYYDFSNHSLALSNKWLIKTNDKWILKTGKATIENFITYTIQLNETKIVEDISSSVSNLAPNLSLDQLASKLVQIACLKFTRYYFNQISEDCNTYIDVVELNDEYYAVGCLSLGSKGDKSKDYPASEFPQPVRSKIMQHIFQNQTDLYTNLLKADVIPNVPYIHPEITHCKHDIVREKILSRAVLQIPEKSEAFVRGLYSYSIDEWMDYSQAQLDETETIDEKRKIDKTKQNEESGPFFCWGQEKEQR